MNELLNSPIIKEGTLKVEVEQKSIIMLAVAVLMTSVIMILFGFLLKNNSK
ncbi:MAG: hypothetical protein LBL04_13920 [Bacteroidales bacterium]|jgi:hypothetical protein|nr:hypothetical protein [Bacteroidales bacterium]